MFRFYFCNQVRSSLVLGFCFCFLFLCLIVFDWVVGGGEGRGWAAGVLLRVNNFVVLFVADSCIFACCVFVGGGSMFER